MKKGSSTTIVLIAFILASIVAIILLPSTKRTEPFFNAFPRTAEKIQQEKNAVAVAGINDRLSAMENKIADSDKKQAESVSSINSVLS